MTVRIRPACPMSNPSVDTEIEDEISTVRDEFSSIIRASLIKWCIRSAIGAMLFGYLAYNYSWGIWVLLVWILFAAFSLFVIVRGGAALEEQFQSLEGSFRDLVAEDDLDGEDDRDAEDDLL